MTRRTLVRILEAFFRRRFLYTIPLVASILLGALSVMQSSDEYISGGSILVDPDSLVTSRSGVEAGGFFTYLTPAQFRSQELKGLLQTDVFMESVVATAGIRLSPNPGLAAVQLSSVRQSITGWPVSENLIRVTATTSDPRLSERLTTATIEEFINFEISVDVAESKAAEAFFLELAGTYEQNVTETRRAVDAYLDELAGVTWLTAEQQLALDRLIAAETLAEQRYRSTLEDVEASRLAAEQAETDVRQSMAIVDPPHLPTGATSDLLGDGITLAMYVLVGLAIMVTGPVVATLLDRSVLFPEDLAHIESTRVLSVVSHAGQSERRLVLAADPDLPSSASPVAPAATNPPSEEGAAATPLIKDAARSGDQWERPGTGGDEADAYDTSNEPVSPRRARA